MRPRAWSRNPGWAWAAAGAAVGVLVLAAVLTLTAIARSAAQQSLAGAPVMTVLPRPSATPLVPATPTEQPTQTPGPAAAPEAGDGRIEVGSIVEVYGTEGDGLRLRSEAGTSGAIRVLAGEAEVFTVQDGPREAEGRAWFYVVSPSDASRAGWAVADYLRPAH